MRAFAEAAGERAGDKSRVKHIIQNPENSVMDDPIAHEGFVDMPPFGVMDIKSGVRPVAISAIAQLPMEGKNMLLQIALKPYYIRPPPLAALKKIPGQKQALRPNYFIK